MWNAKIAEKKYEHGTCSLIVEYSDGSDAFTEVYKYSSLGTVFDFSDRVQERLAELAATDLIASSISVGAFIPETKPVVPVIPQTAEEIAQVDFINAYTVLKSAKIAVNLGIIKDTDALFTDALTATTTSFKPNYLEFL